MKETRPFNYSKRQHVQTLIADQSLYQKHQQVLSAKKTHISAVKYLKQRSFGVKLEKQIDDTAVNYGNCEMRAKFCMSMSYIPSLKGQRIQLYADIFKLPIKCFTQWLFDPSRCESVVLASPLPVVACILRQYVRI